MTSRRAFLGVVGAGVAGVVVPRAWSAGAPPRRLDHVGLQLYTVRGEMQKDVEATLERVAAIGYQEVEFAGYFGREPAALRATLDRLKLAAPSVHVGIDAIETRFDATAAAAKSIGHRWLTVPSLPRGALDSRASVASLAARFNAAGRRCVDAGLGFAFHNHGAELRPVEGSVPLEVLVSETDPALVDFQMDVYWVAQGGGDPLALLRKHPARFRMIHAKDSGGPPAHEMRDVGAGAIDWAAVMASGTSIDHVFVEHDRPAEPYASVTASYRFLSSVPGSTRRKGRPPRQ